MEEKRCTGDCLKCSMQQQIYCAAQHGHVIFERQRALEERLDRLAAAVARLAPPGDMISPVFSDAQKDSGAENRESGQL